MQPLGISLLGQGIKEKNSLEKSVKGILDKKSQWTVVEAQSKIKIEGLKNKIYQLKIDKAENHSQLRTLREKDTFVHSIAGGFYSGTAAKIAKDLQKDDKEYSWLKDEIQINQTFPLSSAELSQLCSELEIISADQEKALNLFNPLPGIELPAKDELTKLFSNEKELSLYISENQEILSSHLSGIIKNATIENVCNLSSCIKLLCDVESRITNSHKPWIKSTIAEILSDNSATLKELLRLSKNKAQGLKDKAANVDGLIVKISENLDRKKLLNDAASLKNHLERGGKLTRLGFKTQFSKNHKDLLEKVIIDGEKCNSLERSVRLIDYLSVELCLESIWSLWFGKAEPVHRLWILQIVEIEDLNASLEDALKLVDVLSAAKESIRAIYGLDMPDWNNKQSRQHILHACKFAVCNFEFQENQKSIGVYRDKLLSLLSSNNHDLVRKLYDSFLARNIDDYDTPHILDQLLR